MNRESILLVISGLGTGGAERQLVDLAIALKSAGRTVRVLSLTPGGRYVAILENAGVEVKTLKFGRGRVPGIAAMPQALQAFQFILHARPRAMICFLHHANILGRIAGRLTGCPTIISSFRSGELPSRVRVILERATCSFDTFSTFNSEAAASLLHRNGLVDQNKVRVIYNSFPTDRLPSLEKREQLRQHAKISPQEFVWLSVGRLHEVKNYPAALHALAGQGDHSRPWRYLVAGEGSEREELVRIAGDLGISERVEFLGERRDVADLLALADGFILTSRSEGLPNALIEALASGLPIVATAVGGVPELLQGTPNSILVEHGSPHELASAVRRVMSTADERVLNEGVLRRFRSDIILDQWLALIDSAPA